MVKYKEVFSHKELLTLTLQKLNCMILGTTSMVSRIGGINLDLHPLFVEVTSGGGTEKLIGEKRWREVTAIFKFSSTNASLTLNKYFVCLLHHYDQISFFGAQGWSSPDPSNTLSLSLVPSDWSVEPVKPYIETQIALEKHGNDDCSYASSGSGRELVMTAATGRMQLASGYIFFFTEQSARIQPDHPGGEDIQIWSYQERSQRSKQATHESLKDDDLNEMPIQQCPGEQITPSGEPEKDPANYIKIGKAVS